MEKEVKIEVHQKALKFSFKVFVIQNELQKALYT